MLANPYKFTLCIFISSIFITMKMKWSCVCMKFAMELNSHIVSPANSYGWPRHCPIDIHMVFNLFILYCVAQLNNIYTAYVDTVKYPAIPVNCKDASFISISCNTVWPEAIFYIWYSNLRCFITDRTLITRLQKMCMCFVAYV